jgi:hypothetical protein
LKTVEKMVQIIINSKNRIIEINTKSSDKCSLDCIEELKKRNVYINNIKYKYYFIRVKLEKSKQSNLIFIRFDKEINNFTLSTEEMKYSLGIGKDLFNKLKDKINKVKKSTSKEFKNRNNYLVIRKILIIILITLLVISILLFLLNISTLDFNKLKKISLLSLYVTLILALQDSIDVESKNFTNISRIINTKILMGLEFIIFAFTFVMFLMESPEGFSDILLTFIPIVATIGVLGLKATNLKKLR